MALTPEEQRALDWQAKQKRREVFQRFLQAKFKGDDAEKKRIERNFEPLRRR